ncbi:hypothetical protein VP01_11729g1, partial [Puccinia sorghi]
LPEGFVKPIGTAAIFINQRQVKGRKFHVKGEEGVLVGFDPLLLSYRILCKSRAIIKTKHVRFLKDTNSTIIESSDNVQEQVWRVENEDLNQEDISNCKLLDVEEIHNLEENQFNNSENSEDNADVQQDLIPQKNSPSPEPSPEPIDTDSIITMNREQSNPQYAVLSLHFGLKQLTLK